MTVYFSQPTRLTEPMIFAPLFQGDRLPAIIETIDAAGGGLVSTLIKREGFSGKSGEILTSTLAYGTEAVTVTLLGIGEATRVSQHHLQETGIHIARLFDQSNVKEALLVIPEANETVFSRVTFGCEIAFGFLQGRYRFKQYKTGDTNKSSEKICLRVSLADAAEAHAIFPRYEALAESVTWSRDLGNEPPNIIYPESFARRCEELASIGLTVEVLDDLELEQLGMHAMLGVAKGSDHPARCVVLSWRGSGITDDTAPICLLGKGVTFDSGGLMPKGPEEMWDMKFDMCGASVVAGAMATLARKQAPLHVVALLGLVENLPSGKAMQPGSVVRSLSGTTIEVLHTDAEGRLVLADLIGYAKQRFHPHHMIDVATLTGAMTAVLGEAFAGLFSNDNELATRLIAAGELTGERLWRLPLCEAFDEMLASPIADIQNIPNKRMAGSGAAAQFLNRFAGTTSWAHIDIAGVAWARNRQSAQDFGATGFGVRLLDAFFDDLCHNDVIAVQGVKQ